MTQATYEHLLIERRSDRVALVTINRPRKLNAFSSQTRREFAAALGELGDDPAVGAITLTGAGDRGFIAGLDLSEAQHYRPEDVPTYGDQFRAAYLAILDLDKPTVAAVNGYAVGAGFQLAAICDLRIASENARFGMGEIDDGIPCIVGTYVLWDLVGRGRATELALTGRMIGAEEALAWGIVSRVVPQAQLMDVALEQARLLAAKPRTAMRMNKQWMRELFVPGYLRSKEFARTAHIEAYESGDPQRAMANFVAHRREGRSPT